MVEELTLEEKAAAYDRLQGKKDVRKGQSTAKRKAVQELIKAHKPEYNKMLKAAGGVVKDD